MKSVSRKKQFEPKQVSACCSVGWTMRVEDVVGDNKQLRRVHVVRCDRCKNKTDLMWTKE
jgi:hypothetical protein